ncbi:MAG: SDR family oxidoreductase [Thermoguttaceae bacterium]|jgi:NAD(P)-dependent dehydrogenase (short-subunit alcohol dehydrogenase family)
MQTMEGKIVAITGAASGMGRAIAQGLAADGATLALADCNGPGLAELEAALEPYAGRLFTRVLDVTDEAGVERFFRDLRERFGGCDVLLNAPGLSVVGKIAEMALADYDKMLDVNVKGTFLCSKHFLAGIDPERGGLIVNFASMAARRANANAPLYCTAKAAVAMFSQGLALQAKEQNVRVTTLYPGPTDTAFWGSRQVPREKFMTVDDVVAAVRFVLSLPPRIVVHELAFESFLFFK